MHETNQASDFGVSEPINIGNGDVLEGLIIPREASDGHTPIRAPKSENYYGAMHPDMHPNLAKELAENDRRRYEREIKRRGLLGGLAASDY